MESASRSLWNDERALICAIFVLALVLRLGAVFYLRVPDLTVVSEEEGQIAARLVAGQGYTFDFYGYRAANPLHSFIPPLNVLIRALFLRFAPDPATAFGVAQAFLSSLTCVIVYQLARELAGTLVAAISGVAMAVYPVFIVQSARPFSLTVHTFLLALLLWLLVRIARRSHPAAWVGAGFALGLLALGRSSMIGFLPFIIGWLWLSRAQIPSWRRAGTVIVSATLLALLPWMAHNYYALGEFPPLSTGGGFTLWNGNNPFSTGNAFDVYVGKARAYLGTETGAGLPSNAIMDLRPYPLPREIAPRVEELSEVELDRALYLAAWRFVRENPRAWLELAWTKLVSFWWFRPNIGQSRADLGEYGVIYDSRWITPYKVLYASLFPFFIAGLVLSVRGWRRYALFYLLFGYLTLLFVAFNVMTRYRWEIEPYILLIAVTAVVAVVRKLQCRMAGT